MTREDVIMTLVINHMLDRSGLEEAPNEVLLDYMKYFHEECDGIEGVQQIVSLSEDGETITMSTQQFCDMQNEQFNNGVKSGRRTLIREMFGRELKEVINDHSYCKCFLQNIHFKNLENIECKCEECDEKYIDIKSLFEIIDRRIKGE